MFQPGRCHNSLYTDNWVNDLSNEELAVNAIFYFHFLIFHFLIVLVEFPLHAPLSTLHTHRSPLFLSNRYDPPGVCVRNDVPRCEVSDSQEFPRLWLPVSHWRMSKDACTLCWCTRDKGTAKCLTQKCTRPTKPCVKSIKCPGICCPICLD